MNDFLKRFISALVLAISVLSGIIYLPVDILKIAVSLVSVLAVYELTGLLEDKFKEIKNPITFIVAFLSSLSILFVNIWLSIFIMTLYSFYIGHKFWNLSYTVNTLFILFYGVFFVSSLGVILQIDKYMIFLIFAVVWVGDTAAYFVGKTLGKHKMAPKLSPKKTWEGAVGSFVGSVIAGYLFIYYFHYSYIYLVPVVLSAFLLQVGDLFESFIKRQVNKKDASNLIPGHGGILDRIDSLIFASVVFVIWEDIISKLV
ncbi:MAG: phosphatidate cytidylyltransferase [Hydrogenothermaceae bacterium]